MVIISKGDFVWIERVGGSSASPIGARVLNIITDNTEIEQIVVRDDDGNERRLSDDCKIRVMHPTSIQGVENLVQLEDLHETAVIRNLFIRYNEKLIHTYVGSVLIIVNPFRMLSIYDNNQITLYQCNRAESLPPHVYGIASRAYSTAITRHMNECIVIDGPSGSGKSENFKQILKFFIHQNASLKNVKNKNETGITGNFSSLYSLSKAQQVADTNLILEAFGNAQTPLNSNASRFGKFFDLRFCATSGALESAQIFHFLLEKWRAVEVPIMIGSGERNFHIFYMLLNDLSSKDKMELELNGKPNDYYILGTPVYHDSKDISQIPTTLVKLRCAMKSLMFKDAEITSIFKVLAAILHLGNLKYQVYKNGDDEKVEITDINNLHRIGKLLQINPKNIANTLCQRTVILQGECIIVGQSITRAIDARDAFIASIYGHLFNYVTKRCNDALNGSLCAEINKRPPHFKNQSESESTHVSIGIMDMFGFENLQRSNEFEQFCINFAAEALQQLFIRKIFKYVQVDYESQHIEWCYVDYSDIENLSIIGMIAYEPMSLMSILNDESANPEATSKNLIEKFNAHYKMNRFYMRSKSDLNCEFTIKHYAGPVIYNVNSFLMRNRERFATDFLALVQSSQFRFFQRLFKPINEEHNTTANNEFGHPISPNISDNECTHILTSVSLRQSRILQFHRSIDSLFERIEQRNVNFIRCVRPNEERIELHFDRDFITMQLRHWGVIQTALMQRNCYPICYEYMPFVQKYRMFLPDGNVPDDSAGQVFAAKHICSILLSPKIDIKFGKTKLFLKAEYELHLDQEMRNVLTHYATIVQKIIRGWMARRRYRNLLYAAITLQKHWRKHVQSIRYKSIQRGILRLQALMRSYELMNTYNYLRDVIIRFQAHSRGLLMRKMLRDMVSLETCRSFTLKRNYIFDESEIIAKIEDNCDTNFCFNDELRTQKSKILMLTNNEDFMTYTFEKFAITYFQGSATANYSNRALHTSLLLHEEIRDRVAALCIWLCLQRIMGILPIKLVSKNNIEKKQRINLMREIHLISNKTYTAKQYQLFFKTYKELYTSLEKEDLPEGTDFYTRFLNDFRSTSDLSLLQFVVGHGILNENLRDEIICQICKQLNVKTTRINSSESMPLILKRGWTFLALCIGCFAPTAKFRNYFLGFLYAAECNERLCYFAHYVKNKLERTLKNGTRCQPPCRLEIEACKSMQPMRLEITLMDGNIIELNGDSATTANEICTEIANRTGLSITDSIKDSMHEESCIKPNNRKKFQVGQKSLNQNDSQSKTEDKNEHQSDMDYKFNFLTVEYDGHNKKNERISEKINEDGSFGFALYVANAKSQIVSLGADTDHVFDAIAQAEHNNNIFSTESSRLFYRKELFTPWDDPSKNIAATNLIYHQIIRGFKLGEYKCTKEEEIGLLCAQQYFIDYGTEPLCTNTFENIVVNYLPESELCKDSHDLQKWSQIIMNILRKKFSKDTSENVASVQKNVVLFAINKWPLLFSRFCEAIKFAGPPLRTNEIVIAINAKRVEILDHEDRPLIQFIYPQLIKVQYNKSNRIGADTVTIYTLSDGSKFKSEVYTFQSPNARDIKNLISYFIRGLQHRSKYMVCIRQINSSVSSISSNNEDELNCELGDLLIRDEKIELRDNINGFIQVENTRTGLNGRVAIYRLHVIPTLTRPSVDLMEMFTCSLVSKSLHKPARKNSYSVLNSHEDSVMLYSLENPTINSIKYNNCHTLEKFAAANFRDPVPQEQLKSINRDVNGSNILHNALYNWSSMPLSRPLLKRLASSVDLDEPIRECLLGYEYILRYMGDFSTEDPAYFLEFTDMIFRAPIKFQIVRDELYCQLMKQLTDNPNPISQHRGWELMWLAVGLFPPGTMIAHELFAFLRTRYVPMTAECDLRLQRTIKSNIIRKFPPHRVEVEAIQQGTTQIFHKVFLPDASEIIVEVDNSTRSYDIGLKILTRLRVNFSTTKSTDFGLFVKVGEKVISMPENEYLFDYIHQLTDWFVRNLNQSKQLLQNLKSNLSMKNKNSSLFAYELFFMRKLWIDVVPGEDVNADFIFHYHQELPKYLRGYYCITRDKAPAIGAQILRAQTHDGQYPPFQQFSHIIADIVPSDLLKLYNVSEWKKLICSEFEKLEGFSSAMAKIEFLKQMAKMPTFGSAFFEVKQSSDPTMASHLIVAINRAGVTLFNADSREYIIGYPFTSINSWTFGNTYLHLAIGNGTAIKGGCRLLFETALGYKMDDLLTSYIRTLLSSIDKKKRATKTTNLC